MKFNENAMLEAEELYNKVQITEVQRKVINTLSSKLHEFVPMREIAIRGFALIAARQWQLENKEIASSVENMTPNERIEFMKRVLSIMKGKFKQILINPDDQQKIDDGFNEVLRYYAKTFAQR